MLVRVAIACALSLTFAGPASAQWGDFIKDKINQEAKDKAGRAVHETGDAAYQGAKSKSKEDGQKPDNGAKAEAGKGARSADKASGERGEAATAPGAAAQEEVAAGEVYGNKFDFIPGDKVLLFDDFAETEVGDYPARWTIKEGGGNAVEVASYKGKKWFKSTPGGNGINEASLHWLRYDPKGDMPRKFTIEFDADMGTPFSILFNSQHGYGGREIRYEPHEVSTQNAKSPLKPMGPVVKRVSISVNGTYAKVYIGGARVLQDPEAVERPVKRIGWRFDMVLGRGGSENPAMLEHQMFTNFRVAEGGKDVAQALNAEGRIVVHGIYFDTGSDVIRPESGGALRNILTVMQGNESMRFRIEGHTDDQGGPAVNGPLSEKRAAAVKRWLEEQGVAASRLEPKGLGATKPMDSNATQEGRANNRRVEFVKL